MSAAMAESLFGNRQEWSRNFAAATAMGLFLGFVGPFGSCLNGSHWLLLAYWVGSLWSGAFLFGLTLRPAMRAAPRWRLPPAGVLAAATLIAAVPLSLLCHAAAGTLWPGPIQRIGLLAWYGQTLIISAPLVIGYGLLRSVRWRNGQPPPQAPASAPLGTARQEAARPLLSRLPLHLGRELVALQMGGHYVRVHTKVGSTLVLMPFHQAFGSWLDNCLGCRCIGHGGSPGMP